MVIIVPGKMENLFHTTKLLCFVAYFRIEKLLPGPRTIEINESHPVLHRDHNAFMLAAAWQIMGIPFPYS